MSSVPQVHTSAGATPFFFSIQHGGHASYGGRSPVNRSSVEIQVSLNLKCMTTLHNYIKRGWNKLPTRRFVPVNFKQETLCSKRCYLSNRTLGASGRLTMKAHVQWLLQLWMVTNSYLLWTLVQSRNTLSKNKELDKSQTWKGGLGKSEHLGGLKTQKGGPGKIRDMNKNDYPDRLKPKRAIYAKLKDHDKVTASVRHNPLGAFSYQKTFDSKHLQIKDSELGHSKLLGRITVIVFNVPSPIFTIFQKISKIRGVMSLAGHHSIH